MLAGGGLAFAYRQQFHKDVVIDMVCYRRHGHNEGDDPSYTQPLMYKAIDKRRSVRKLFVESLVKRGELTLDEAEEALADYQQKLQDRPRRDAPDAPAVVRRPGHRSRSACCPTSRPGSPRDDRPPLRPADRLPRGFTPHPKLVRQFEARSKLYPRGRGRVGHR